MPGVVKADVDCATGKAVCDIKPAVDVSQLVEVIRGEGFEAAPAN